MSPDWPWPVVLASSYRRPWDISTTSSWWSTSAAAWDYREPVMDRVRDRCSSRRSGISSALLALDAPARPVVDLVVAALELCRLVRGLGHGDLAAQLAAHHPAAAARGDRGLVRDARPGPASRDATRLIGAGRGSWLLRLPRQRVVPLAAPRVGRGDPRICPSRSTACKSSSSATCTSPRASSAGFSSR